MVGAMRAQAEIERRNGNDEIAEEIDDICNRINVNTAPADKVFDILVLVNEGKFNEARIIVIELEGGGE